MLWTLFLCLVIRFIGVFFLSWLINMRRIKDISLKEQFIMAYGGLRGAVGFSLVAILPDEGEFKVSWGWHGIAVFLYSLKSSRNDISISIDI